MKYLILMITLLFSTVVFSQIRSAKSYDIDSVGIRNLLPSKKFMKEGNTTKVYNYNKTGVRKILPSSVLVESGNKIKQYKVNKTGFRELFPSKIIKVTKDEKWKF